MGNAIEKIKDAGDAVGDAVKSGSVNGTIVLRHSHNNFISKVINVPVGTGLANGIARAFGDDVIKRKVMESVSGAGNGFSELMMNVDISGMDGLSEIQLMPERMNSKGLMEYTAQSRNFKKLLQNCFNKVPEHVYQQFSKQKGVTSTNRPGICYQSTSPSTLPIEFVVVRLKFNNELFDMDSNKMRIDWSKMLNGKQMIFEISETLISTHQANSGRTKEIILDNQNMSVIKAMTNYDMFDIISKEFGKIFVPKVMKTIHEQFPRYKRKVPKEVIDVFVNDMTNKLVTIRKGCVMFRKDTVIGLMMYTLIMKKCGIRDAISIFLSEYDSFMTDTETYLSDDYNCSLNGKVYSCTYLIYRNIINQDKSLSTESSRLAFEVSYSVSNEGFAVLDDWMNSLTEENRHHVIKVAQKLIGKLYKWMSRHWNFKTKDIWNNKLKTIEDLTIFNSVAYGSVYCSSERIVGYRFQNYDDATPAFEFSCFSITDYSNSIEPSRDIELTLLTMFTGNFDNVDECWKNRHSYNGNLKLRYTSFETNKYVVVNRSKGNKFCEIVTHCCLTSNGSLFNVINEGITE